MPTLYDYSHGSLVHQILLTHGEIDRVPDRRILDIKRNFPGTHRLWTDDDITYLLKNKFGLGVLNAYKKLKPLALKADLARYCILYEYGGWYFDLTVSIDNLDALKCIDTDSPSALVFRDIPIEPGNFAASVVNTIMWFREPKHQILNDVITRIVFNANNDVYSTNPMAVTGSIVLGTEVVLYQLQHEKHDLVVGDCIMVDNKPTHVFNTVRYPSYIPFTSRRSLDSDVSKEMPSGYETKSNYYQMWFDRDIYN